MYGIKDFYRGDQFRRTPPSSRSAAGRGARDREETARIEVAQIMSVTMSCDHRAVDGAPPAPN